jgi:hypothetical protein
MCLAAERNEADKSAKAYKTWKFASIVRRNTVK